jgi:diguanylate cyclase (GGDEF)-like protein/PAS domain S-box-containing protein
MNRMASLARLRNVSPSAVWILLLGLFASVVLAAGTRNLEHQRVKLDFEQRANARIAAVTRSFEEANNVLFTLNLLFAKTSKVTRSEFAGFAQALIDSNPYIQALVFHRIVRSDERAVFEAARRRLYPGFQITERTDGHVARAGDRPFYLVDDFVVPLAGNEVTLGYDAWSSPNNREMFVRAIDTGKPAAGVLKNLLQEAGTMRGITIAMPVYRAGADLSTVDARRRAVVGDTEVVLVPSELVGGQLKRAGLAGMDDIALKVFGTGLGRKLELAYSTASADDAPSRWIKTWKFDVAGQAWQVVVWEREAPLANHLGSISTLVAGILLSVMAAAFVQSRVQRTKRIEQLVEERTADLKRTSDSLRLHKRAIDSSANSIIIINATLPGYPIEYVNPAYERMMGYTATEMVGRTMASIASGQADQPAIQALRDAVRRRCEGHTLLRHTRKDGSEIYSELYIAPVKDEAGKTGHFVMTQYDVTTAKCYEAELEHRARYDRLTGLPNRSLLNDRIEQAIAFAQARADPVWVVTFDLDNFKYVNDTLGHQAGDLLLQELAPRIAAAMAPTDTASRTGGDEFALVLTGSTDEGQVAAMVHAVMHAIAQPLTLKGQTLVVTCSAGIAAFPADGTDPETLIKHAEIAMYRAKELGRNTEQFYRPAMNKRALERLSLESALRNALAREELELHYQPQVELASGRVIGMEALVRWHHPQFGMVRPDRFIALAEETGLIVPIGAWVLGTACKQNKAWQRAGLGQLRIAVNLSARQFADTDLMGLVAGVLEENQLDPPSLEIELTESLVMANVDLGIHTMHELKALGVKLSIDDFGTGYSSLAYLKRFPVDTLKIDQSFVRDIAASHDDAAMVGAIISLAHDLRMQVIAEGVETEEQLDYLRLRGCDEIQGYYFSRALPNTEAERILREGRGLEPAAGEVGARWHVSGW